MSGRGRHIRGALWTAITILIAAVAMTAAAARARRRVAGGARRAGPGGPGGGPERRRRRHGRRERRPAGGRRSGGHRAQPSRSCPGRHSRGISEGRRGARGCARQTASRPAAVSGRGRASAAAACPAGSPGARRRPAPAGRGVGGARGGGRGATRAHRACCAGARGARHGATAASDADRHRAGRRQRAHGAAARDLDPVARGLALQRDVVRIERAGARTGPGDPPRGHGLAAEHHGDPRTRCHADVGDSVGCGRDGAAWCHAGHARGPRISRRRAEAPDIGAPSARDTPRRQCPPVSDVRGRCAPRRRHGLLTAPSRRCPHGCRSGSRFIRCDTVRRRDRRTRPPSRAARRRRSPPDDGRRTRGCGAGAGGGAAAAALMTGAALFLIFLLSTRVSLDLSAWRSTLLSLRLERPG